MQLPFAGKRTVPRAIQSRFPLLLSPVLKKSPAISSLLGILYPELQPALRIKNGQSESTKRESSHAGIDEFCGSRIREPHICRPGFQGCAAAFLPKSGEFAGFQHFFAFLCD
jgi:hypothetical protein